MSGVPTVGGTTTGSRSVVEVLASVEALEKEGYVTGLRAKRIRTRIGRLVVHAIARQPQPLKGGTMSHDSRSPQEMRGSAQHPDNSEVQARKFALNPTESHTVTVSIARPEGADIGPTGPTLKVPFSIIVRCGRRLRSIPHPLHVHHRSFERRGDESVDDLVVLCADCHSAVHFHDGAHRPRV